MRAKGDAEAIEGMAFALDYAAESERRKCAGYKKLDRWPITHRDCLECGGYDEWCGMGYDCPGYRAAAAVDKWRQSAADGVRHRPSSDEELAILDRWYPMGGSRMVLQMLASSGYVRNRRWCHTEARARGLIAGGGYNPAPCRPELQERLNALERVMLATQSAAKGRMLDPSAREIVAAALETLRAWPELVDEINRGGVGPWL